MSRRIIVKREDSDVKEIDKSVKNKWCWPWMEHEHKGTCFSAYFRKLLKPGYALCVWCDKEVNYGGKGLSSLVQHSETAQHLKIRKIRESNFRLPSTCK